MSDGPETCTRLLVHLGRSCEGRLDRWMGTDGHNGVEWFTTCKRCGTTT